MSLFNMGDKAYVMLANGRIFEGYSFGAKGTSVGEIVFATGMTGYCHCSGSFAAYAPVQVINDKSEYTTPYGTFELIESVIDINEYLTLNPTVPDPELSEQ